MSLTIKYQPKKTLFKLSLFTWIMQFWIGLIILVQPFADKPGIPITLLILHSYTILKGILWFILAQLLIYTLYFYLVWGIIKWIVFTFECNEKASFYVTITIWWMTVFLLYLANQIFFPWSNFCFIPRTLLIFLIEKYLFYSLFSLCLAFLAYTFIKTFIKLDKMGKQLLILLMMLTCFGYFSLAYFNSSHALQPKQTFSKQPNIIIIGIDSLRPDTLASFHSFNQGANDKSLKTNHYFNERLIVDSTNFWTIKSLMPNVDQFLKGSSIFTNAWSPIARTFPAWVSLLTGEPPLLNHVRYSLPDPDSLIGLQTIAHRLQKAGYHTIFASDDRRFNYIQKQYGFDDIIAPPSGFNDFMLGEYNDFPLSNFLVNTPFGKWLFPYSYSNRAPGFAYKPSTFVTFFREHIEHIPNRPIFLGVHLLLPHWPFYFAKAPYYLTQNEEIKHKLLYQTALAAADEQFQALINVLKQNHFLDNSLVIVLSDHGQAVGLPGEKLTEVNGLNQEEKSFWQHCKNNSNYKDSKCKLYAQAIELSYGHGTDILNRSQTQIVLAMKGFGSIKIPEGKSALPVSIFDLAPTILNMAHIPVSPNLMSHALSLWPLITHDKTAIKTFERRPQFLETGFNLSSLLIANPQKSKALAEGINYFTISPETGAVFIKPALQDSIIKSKQRLVFIYPWFFAYIPQIDGPPFWVYGNMQTKQWTLNAKNQLVQKGVQQTLMQQMQQFYGPQFNK